MSKAFELAAMAMALTAAAVYGTAPAHASPPAVPCDYDCKWPAGSYSISDEVAAGGTFEIAWTYSWDPQDAVAISSRAEGSNEGHYTVTGEVANLAPPGYTGSAVTLRLPQELEVVGWRDAGLEREMLWTDIYGRTMYEYTGHNAYVESGRHSKSITVRLAEEGMFYPVTELEVDLGLSVADSAPPVLHAYRYDAGARLSAEPPDAAGVSGAAYEHQHRQALRWPPPEIETAAMPAGAAGAAGEGETYVYGYFHQELNDPAGDVRACLYDRGEGTTLTRITRDGAAACTQTSPDGFYSMVFPQKDPDGDGTDADVTVRFTLEGEGATVMTRGQPTPEPYAMYVNAPNEALSSTLSMGTVRAQFATGMRAATAAYMVINDARAYFLDTFSYDVPHVTVQNLATGVAAYRPSDETIRISISARDPPYADTLRHEYGHHVMAQTSGIPPTEACRIHYFNRASSESCAWSEGWAEFVVALVSNSPVVDRGRIGFDLEVPGTNGVYGTYTAEHGPDVEGRVAGVLWDIHDSGAGEAHDNVDGGVQLIWDVLLDEPGRGERYAASSILDFRDDWNDAGYPSLDGVFSQNGLPVGQGASMAVLDSNGNAKSGGGRALALAGETVMVTVALDAQAGGAPAISFYGGAPVAMSPAGAAGLWSATHAITASTREGMVSFAVSRGGETVATLHDVSAEGRVIVDRTAPRALSAEFVAPGSIVIEFSEPLAPLGAAAFAVAPPGSSNPPVAVPASLSAEGTEVTLTVEPAASVDGSWSVAVPGTLADPAGNAHGSRTVTAEFLADSDPPTFSTTRVSATQIAVEFDEDIRLPRSGRLPSFVLINGEQTMTATISYIDLPNRRISLSFANNVFAGTLFYRLSGGVPYFEDSLGNAVVDGANAPVSEAITPAFRIGIVPSRDRSIPAYGVSVEFSVPVSGTVSVSDWRINGKQPGYFSLGRSLSGDERRQFPFTEGALTSSTLLHVHMDVPACDGSVQVEYVAPDSSPLSSTTGAVRLESMGASSPCSYIVPHSAKFLDSRTLSVAFDRPPRATEPDSFVVDGLGQVLGHQGHESRVVTLHVRDAAVAGDTYVVTNNDLRDDAKDAFRFTLPVAMSMKATYMDKTPPTVTPEFAKSQLPDGLEKNTHIKLYLSEPLDAATLTGKAFTTDPCCRDSRFIYTGGFSAHYLSGERVVYLIPQEEIGARGVGVSVPAGITDVNGVAIAPQNISATGYRGPFSTIEVQGPRTVAVMTHAPLSEESLKHIRITPSVGELAVSQDGTTVTITSEKHFGRGIHQVVIPPEAEHANGRKIARLSSQYHQFDYLDTVAPTATAMFVTPREIMIKLSEPLDAMTVGPRSFTVTPPLGYLGVKYDSDRLEVLLEASEPARPGTDYTVRVFGVADRAGLALSPTSMRVSHGTSALFTGAVFTSSKTIEVMASAPLDPETLGGISVSGLGQAIAEYDSAARTVTLSTSRVAESGAVHRVFIPETVMGSDGMSAGPAVLEAANGFGRTQAPVAVWAQTMFNGHVSISFDRRVGPAAGFPGSLDASRWTVTLAGGEAVTASSAVAVGKTVWLQYVGDDDLNRLRQHVTTHMEDWNPPIAVAALAVSYAPGGGAGDAASATTARSPLAAMSLPVEDRLPPTFTATTSRLATIVTFDREVSGATAAADWLVAGEPAAGVSALGPGAGAPASGTARVILPAGTTRIALHHAPAGSDDEPLVNYAPRGRSLAIMSDGILMAPWVARAGDGVGPTVVDAAFTGPKTLHVSLDEAPKTLSVSTAAFKITNPAGAAVVVTSADHTPHSRTVSLGLESDAAAGAHMVTATSAITDPHGNASVASAPAVMATYAAPTQGGPIFSASVRSERTIMITFDPPVSGTTSSESWEIRGAPVMGVRFLDGTFVPDPSAASISLPEGTMSITLGVQPGVQLDGSGDEPIVHYVGTGIVAGGVPLGKQAAKAADDAGPEILLMVGRDGLLRVSFSEPIKLSEGNEAARNGHWTARSAADFDRVVPVNVSTDGDSALVLRTREEIRNLAYDGSKTGGAIVDASGNFGRGLQTDVRILRPVGQDFFVRQSPDGVYAGNLGGALTQPGIPVFVFTGSDGDRVGVHSYRDSTSVSIAVTPPLVAGDRYEVTPPALADRRGIPLSDTKSFVYGSDGDPPTVESARFAGPREVRVTFSEPLAAVPAGAAFSVTPTGGTAIPLAANGVSHAAGLRTVTLSLSAAASPGAHEVRVPTAVMDLAGNAYATPGTPIPVTYDTIAPTAVSAAFTGERIASLTVSEALDAATVGMVRVPSLGATSASYAEGSTTVTLHTQLAAATGSSHAVVIPAGVTDANGVPIAPVVLWAARADTAAPAAIGARTVSPTATEVDFGEAIRLGDSPTAEQHAAHWTVTEAGSARAVTGAEVVRGGLSVRLAHAPVGASAMPSVSYISGTDDAASVRDWAATPNYMASTTMDVAAGDGLPPSIDSLTMSVSRPGEADAPERIWARAGDTVKFAMSMSEAAGTSDPVIRLVGSPRDMTPSGEGRRAWTHSHIVSDMGAEQGALAFVVSASDGGQNFAYAAAPTSGVVPIIDTVIPTFMARTLGAGLVEVTLSEPVRGTITASEWTVDDAPSTGVAATANTAPGPASTFAGERFVLWHGGGASTDGMPVVRYNPPNPT